MKFNCPYCRKECDYMDLSLGGDLRAIIAMSDGFGRHRSLVWAYAELFGISPLHAKAKKLRTILEAVKKLFDAGEFSYQKRLYRISPEGIVEALNIVVLRNFPDGLDGHNYLKKIMIGIAEREDKNAGRRVDADLRSREGRAVSAGQHRDAESSFSENEDFVPGEDVATPRTKQMPRAYPLDDAELERNRQRLKQAIKDIG